MKIINSTMIFSVTLMSGKECNDFKLTKKGKNLIREKMITFNILVIIRYSPYCL